MRLPWFDDDTAAAAPITSAVASQPRRPESLAGSQLSSASAEPSAPTAEISSGRLLITQPAVATSHEPIALSFRHPHAEREIRLGEVHIAYAFKRAQRRSIGMVVDEHGLSVRAPRWVSYSDVEAALRDKAKWICAKLDEQRQRAHQHNAARIEWRDGTSLPFIGETVIVVLDPRVTGSELHTDAQALPGVPRLTLHVGLPQNCEPEQLRDAVQAWLQRQAKRIFAQRCEHFAQRLGVRMTRMLLSSAQTRWGSATEEGVIRLNWRLVHFGMATIDYVVAHELAHLREMNHSARFWDVVRSVIPDVETARDQLRSQVVPDLGVNRP